jgi:hypothetical protein
VRSEIGVIGIGDGIELLGAQPRSVQAEAHRRLGELPRGERNGILAVLATGEALLLGRGHDASIADDRGSRIMEDGIDAEHLHRGAVLSREHFSNSPSADV